MRGSVGRSRNRGLRGLVLLGLLSARPTTAADHLPINVTMRSGERIGERLYQPRFPWWESFETRAYPVVRVERNGSLTLLLRLAVQGDQKPGLRAVEFVIDGSSTPLPFKKTWVDRSGCRVDEYLEVEGQEALIRRLAFASEAKVVFTTVDGFQEQVLSATQRDSFSAVLALYARGAEPEPLSNPRAAKTPPKAVHRVPPDYPADTLARQRRGRVVLQTKVLEDGSVEVGDVLDSDAPYCGFEEAAFQAVRQWRYEPGLRDGEPVEVDVTIMVEFTFR